MLAQAASVLGASSALVGDPGAVGRAPLGSVFTLGSSKMVKACRRSN